MPDDANVVRTDHDAIHILPLSSIPLVTQGLKRARLVKNARLEGRVELFAEAGTGSGQVTPHELYRIFDFAREPHPDVDLIQKLSELPSFDVFSSRIHLRRLGVEIENATDLRLSESETARLSVYMREFLKPLMASIYGEDQSDDLEPSDLVGLFKSPDTARAKQNLIRLADDLESDILEIPHFIQEYGDAYLSLSYYQHYFDDIQPALEEFFDALDQIAEAPPMNRHQTANAVCAQISHIRRKLKAAQLDITWVMDMFHGRTGDMWQAITAEKFRRMQSLIREYQVCIGGALCTISVKMMAWKSTFPKLEVGSIARRTDFVMSDIGPGIDALSDIKYSDVG